MDRKILNTPTSIGTMTIPPLDLALKLQRTMLRLKGDHMTPDGRGVDYGNLQSSDLYKEYVELSQQLAGCDPSCLEPNERKAFFINVYNTLTIHGLASSDPLPGSVLEVQAFWKTTSYLIGGCGYSLDDIEHGVLRGNKLHPSASQPQFLDGDPRMVMVLGSCDPRIHFALVCGAKSCPAIQVYSGKNIDSALDKAAASFIEQEVGVSEKGISLSKIFLWYASDFGSNETELLKFISKYLPDSERELLDKQLQSGAPPNITHTDYNWQLNKL